MPLGHAAGACRWGGNDRGATRARVLEASSLLEGEDGGGEEGDGHGQRGRADTDGGALLLVLLLVAGSGRVGGRVGGRSALARGLGAVLGLAVHEVGLLVHGELAELEGAVGGRGAVGVLGGAVEGVGDSRAVAVLDAPVGGATDLLAAVHGDVVVVGGTDRVVGGDGAVELVVDDLGTRLAVALLRDARDLRDGRSSGGGGSDGRGRHFEKESVVLGGREGKTAVGFG